MSTRAPPRKANVGSRQTTAAAGMVPAVRPAPNKHPQVSELSIRPKQLPEPDAPPRDESLSSDSEDTMSEVEDASERNRHSYRVQPAAEHIPNPRRTEPAARHVQASQEGNASREMLKIFVLENPSNTIRLTLTALYTAKLLQPKILPLKDFASLAELKMSSETGYIRRDINVPCTGQIQTILRDAPSPVTKDKELPKFGLILSPEGIRPIYTSSNPNDRPEVPGKQQPRTRVVEASRQAITLSSEQTPQYYRHPSEIEASREMITVFSEDFKQYGRNHADIEAENRAASLLIDKSKRGGRRLSIASDATDVIDWAKQKSNKLEVKVGNSRDKLSRTISALLDTGANDDAIPLRLAQDLELKLEEKEGEYAIMADKTRLEVRYSATLYIGIGIDVIKKHVSVVDTLTHDLVLSNQTIWSHDLFRNAPLNRQRPKRSTELNVTLFPKKTKEQLERDAALARQKQAEEEQRRKIEKAEREARYNQCSTATNPSSTTNNAALQNSSGRHGTV